MKKKFTFLLLSLAVSFVFICTFEACSTEKIEVGVVEKPVSMEIPDSVSLRVYVENSGSMDGYMCDGSHLKDAVYDYISQLGMTCSTVELNYINTQIIQRGDDQDSFIRTLNPMEFKNAGGNRKNSNLSAMFEMILEQQNENTVSVFVSDCILDIDKNKSPSAFFGNTQVKMRNIFHKARQKQPSLSVEVARLESLFDGKWWCGSNNFDLNDVKRPYYIWVMGSKDILAKINSTIPLSDIMHGITHYCAFVPEQNVPVELVNTSFQLGGNNKISLQALANLSTSLQEDDVLTDTLFYTSSKKQVSLQAINKIVKKDSPYTHALIMEVDNPQKLTEFNIVVDYPTFPLWAEDERYNDETGVWNETKLESTTGIRCLLQGVAEAYNNAHPVTKIDFLINNK